MQFFTVPTEPASPVSPAPELALPPSSRVSLLLRHERATNNRERILEERRTKLAHHFAKVMRAEQRRQLSMKLHRQHLESVLKQAECNRQQHLKRRINDHRTRLEEIESRRKSELQVMRDNLEEMLRNAEQNRTELLLRKKQCHYKSRLQELESKRRQEEQNLKLHLERVLKQAEQKRQIMLQNRLKHTARYGIKPNVSDSKNLRERIEDKFREAESKRNERLRQLVNNCAEEVARAKMIAERKRQNQDNAATKIQAWWRKKKWSPVLNAIKKNDLTPKNMKNLEFEQMASVVQEPKSLKLFVLVVRRAKKMVNIKVKDSVAVRVLLSANMIVVHKPVLLGESLDILDKVVLSKVMALGSL